MKRSVSSGGGARDELGSGEERGENCHVYPEDHEGERKPLNHKIDRMRHGDANGHIRAVDEQAERHDRNTED